MPVSPGRTQKWTHKSHSHKKMYMCARCALKERLVHISVEKGRAFQYKSQMWPVDAYLNKWAFFLYITYPINWLVISIKINMLFQIE